MRVVLNRPCPSQSPGPQVGSPMAEIVKHHASVNKVWLYSIVSNNFVLSSILSPVIFYLERRGTWCNILGSCSQSTVTPLQFMMKRFMMFTMFMMTMTTCMRARTEGAMWERSTTEPPSPSSAPGTWSALEVRLGTRSLSPLLILMGLWCVRIPTEDFTDVAQCVGTIVHQLCLWC